MWQIVAHVSWVTRSLWGSGFGRQQDHTTLWPWVKYLAFRESHHWKCTLNCNPKMGDMRQQRPAVVYCWMHQVLMTSGSSPNTDSVFCCRILLSQHGHSHRKKCLTSQTEDGQIHNIFELLCWKWQHHLYSVQWVRSRGWTAEGFEQAKRCLEI